MEGLSLPFVLNNGKFSIFANGLLGLGSQGVPSTRAHLPTLVPVPMTLCRIRECACMCALANTIDSLILTPGPIAAFGPMLTFGPSYKKKIEAMYVDADESTASKSSYRGSRMYNS